MGSDVAGHGAFIEEPEKTFDVLGFGEIGHDPNPRAQCEGGEHPHDDLVVVDAVYIRLTRDVFVAAGEVGQHNFDA